MDYYVNEMLISNFITYMSLKFVIFFLAIKPYAIKNYFMPIKIVTLNPKLSSETISIIIIYYYTLTIRSTLNTTPTNFRLLL